MASCTVTRHLPRVIAVMALPPCLLGAIMAHAVTKEEHGDTNPTEPTSVVHISGATQSPTRPVLVRYTYIIFVSWIAMYRPDEFRVEDLARMHSLMRARPFASLVSNGSTRLYPTPLPTVLKAE